MNILPFQTYSVKTPPKYTKLADHLNICPENPAQKKRKVAVNFDFNSDSSENTDILVRNVCGNQNILYRVYFLVLL